MWPRLLIAAVASLLLLGCATDERQVAICRAVAAVVPATPADIVAEEAAGTGIVRLRLVDAAGGGDHRLDCHFGGGALSDQRLVLTAVDLDGESLSDIRMMMLWRWLGLAPPASLIAQPAAAPLPPARRLAYLLQQLINGVSLGSVTALVATGYSLVYGVTGTIQFAYGEVFMIGAFLVVVPVVALTTLGIVDPLTAAILALPFAAAINALYGWTTARLVYRPLFGAGRLNPLIAGIGLAIALREYVRLVQGSREKWLPDLLSGRFIVFDGGGFTVYLAEKQVLTVGLASMIALTLAWLLTRTDWGRAYRACADDPQMAALVGVDIHRTIGLSFALGAALAAIAGAIVLIQYGEADADMGYLLGFKALTAALLGGFGMVTGAWLGGLLIGLVQVLWAGYFSNFYGDVAVFSVLSLVLILRPNGLLGRAE